MFLFQAFPDNAARREVESLPAICPNDGCTWKGTLKEYEVDGHFCSGLVAVSPAAGFTKLLIYLYLYAFVFCLHVCLCKGVEPLELELQTVIS